MDGRTPVTETNLEGPARQGASRPAAPGMAPAELPRRSVAIVITAAILLLVLGTSAGRERLMAWLTLSHAALSRPPQVSVFVEQASSLDTEQARAARWIARRHRVALAAVEQIVDAAFIAAADHRLDPYLVLAVISIESAFNPLAESAAGAKGLMQVMPQVHAARFDSYGGVEAALEPRANIQVGAQILREYLDRFVTLESALAAYVGVGPSGSTGFPARVIATRDRIHAAAMGRALASVALESERR